MPETGSELHYFILSDSIGDTALRLARSALAQFPDAKTILHKYAFINTIQALDSILDEAAEVDGLLFMTIVDNDLAQHVERFCVETGLICYNLSQPFVLEISRRLGMEPIKKVGAQHELSDSYFSRIEAIEFCIQYDDGRDPKGLLEAEIVLLGISRTGKTPLSMYLGTLGYKVANLPVIPEHTLPEELFHVDRSRIVGLTNSLEVLHRHRESRMLEYGISSSSKYASKDRLNEEILYADQVFRQIGCPILNVADRSIEESASIIIDILGLPVK